jgi:hypothetical protein
VPQILFGLFVFVFVGAWSLQFFVATAYPTSFYNSAVPFTVPSLLRGANLYAANCAACHGAEGHGDGPLARNTPLKPADLTAAHIFEHSDGDLFWWISEGISAGNMPGFGAMIDPQGRWDLINFIHARAASAQPHAVAQKVTEANALPAPNFVVDRHGKQSSLQQELKQGPVLLVFYRLPQSADRLRQLAAAEEKLSAAGLRLVALPLSEEEPSPLPDFAVTSDDEVGAAYRLFAAAQDLAPCEFLIDGAGFLRARWPDAGVALADPASLIEQTHRLAQLSLQLPTHAHTH